MEIRDRWQSTRRNGPQARRVPPEARTRARRCLRAAVLALVGAGALASCGGGSTTADNPCGLQPTGTLTDGTFVGTMYFAGVSTGFPLEVVLVAARRTLSGALTTRDALERFEGTVDCVIDPQGGLSGTYSQVGASTGKRITGTVKGFTDNESACGTWVNSGDQNGTWSVERNATR